MKKLLFSSPAIEIHQPLGAFYVTAMPAAQLSSISKVDVRHFEDSMTAVEQFVGIQRTRDPRRVKDIAQYVKTIDATFPTSIVIAVEDDRCISFDANKRALSFFELEAADGEPGVPRGEIARILDGQHRLAGLTEADTSFDLPVTVFAGIEIADEAYIFATVNLAQTKVNASLAYDLLAYSKSRSPERTCHEVAVALNSASGSPFWRQIKRLGSATPGVTGETLTQATFVKALLPYISRHPMEDRETLRRGHSLRTIRDQKEIRQTPFRNLFVEEKDSTIADIIWEYFDSVRQHWPLAWQNAARGQIIRRTNGFRAFMRVLGEAYHALGGNDAKQPKAADYGKLWNHSTINDADFTSDVYLPGTSGEKNLASGLRSAINVYRTKVLAT